MFDLHKPQDRLYLASPFVWPYRECNVYVDRYYSILAPVVCTKGHHVFMGNPDAINAVCSMHKKGK